jgi:hypothetical protein
MTQHLHISSVALAVHSVRHRLTTVFIFTFLNLLESYDQTEVRMHKSFFQDCIIFTLL